MGNHKVAGARRRAAEAGAARRRPPGPRFARLMPRGRKALAVRDWPVSWRLLTVIVMALLMGLVFGGLRVADAVSSADQFGRVSQLANLGEQVTNLVQALENERDETTAVVPNPTRQEAATLRPWYAKTNAAAAGVRSLAASVGAAFPANIRARAATVLAEATQLGVLRSTARESQSALAVIAAYATPIDNMIALNDQIAQGTSDASLANDVQALDSLAQAKDEAAQQRALLFDSLQQAAFADGVQQALTTAQSEELTDETAFDATATPAQQASFRSTVAGPEVDEAQLIEQYVLSVGSLNTSGPGALNLSSRAAAARWYPAMSTTIDDMQTVGQQIAANIAARARSLQQGAERSALIIAAVTVVVLILVAIATLYVARSLVRPLRRLRAGALHIAAVQLPERVRTLGESADPGASLEVAPIDVVSADEIGQVARAFDQVHAEAVRLAGNEAMLRGSFNAMFVNLSRRSQLLIERLARMIDSLEQNEEDPDRLASLFSMDHLVTRMRRNSENLLLLAGHEGARRWSEPVLLADVARAATSEIEQYGRVILDVHPSVSVSGRAVTDIVHLLAELLENATIFSPKDTEVYLSAQELTSGGILIEISDSGVGISESRLAEMNWRLDNPPVMDVSVSRHMGLFAVGRLAQRHGVRVRLRPGVQAGLAALVWMPDGVIDRTSRPAGSSDHPPERAHAANQARLLSGRRGLSPRASTHKRPEPAPATAAALTAPGPAHSGTPGQTGLAAAQTAVTVQPVTGAYETSQAGGSVRSIWFHGTQPSGSPDGDGWDGDGWDGDGWDGTGRHAARIIADPIRGEEMTSGLPTRVPQANLIPGSAGGGWNGSQPAPGGRPQTFESPSAHRSRSPDTARHRLSGFQRGTRRAQGTRREGEGADR